MLNLVQIKKDILRNFPEIILEEKKVEQFQLFISTLLQWNKSVNLTAIRTPEEVFYKHILDSLVPFKEKIIPENGKFVDLGSGAGVPGIIFSIMNPKLKIDSYDKVEKKIIFQQLMKSKLGVSNFKAIHDKITEKFILAEEEKYDFLITRAFSSMKTIIQLADKLILKNGVLILWKGEKWKEELDQMGEMLRRKIEIEDSYFYTLDKYNLGGVILKTRYLG